MKLMTATLFTMTALLSMPTYAGILDQLGQVTEPTKEQTEQTQSSDLVGTVMSQLGLSQTQAEGGLGSLLSLAQSSLGSNEFSSIADSIPGIDGLLGAVPELDKDSGMSGLLSKAGGFGESLQGSAMVYDAFEQLGISKELAAPMIDIVKGYLDTNGSAGTADLLMQGLNSIL
ncbi:DUF2780 domain-containing protein [Shewanella sp. MBTL60-007]|uniref:DUF2780 domain-containing protein n=1 Tax=Shewanella sp. MBTL60-007 TaxID=2815911 RepID=UPI001BBF3E61|nr:DUF2780 domain-containing protein [Shewanella sp. MBTL60-007]GIU28809.1 hypothetical protein TUM3792_37920 [Shewanella sp. MBTL60-007]